MTNKEITKALDNFKRAGYAQVSLSELAHATKIDKIAILKTLKFSKYSAYETDGETYIQLKEAVQSCHLRKPRVDFYEVT